MSSAIFIRLANENDVEEILQIFRSTIETVCAKDYSPEQIEAWVSGADYKERWLKMIAEQFFYVAETNEQVSGFASVTSDGYLDTLYVHKDAQGKGIASLLLNTIELKMQELGLHQMHTDASITAKPFFLRKGFVTEREYKKLYKGVLFMNTIMRKMLV